MGLFPPSLIIRFLFNCSLDYILISIFVNCINNNLFKLVYQLPPPPPPKPPPPLKPPPPPPNPPAASVAAPILDDVIC